MGSIRQTGTSFAVRLYLATPHVLPDLSRPNFASLTNTEPGPGLGAWDCKVQCVMYPNEPRASAGVLAQSISKGRQILLIHSEYYRRHDYHSYSLHCIPYCCMRVTKGSAVPQLKASFDGRHIKFTLPVALLALNTVLSTRWIIQIAGKYDN